MSDSWRWVTDGGLETDLIFHHGADLPEFAAYPLVRTEDGRALLRRYYDAYARIAEQAGRGLRLETPTWRANPDWGAALGDDAAALADVNRSAVGLMRTLAEEWEGRVAGTTVVGMVGPRGDGYDSVSTASPDEAADYHAAQIAVFAQEGADEVSALTLTGTGEALGVVRAAEAAGIRAVVSFTVETDGRLPDGTPLGEAIETVDATAPPSSFLVNCAHPQHLVPAFPSTGPWGERIRGLRCNASMQSHPELDEAKTLDEGTLDVLVPSRRTVEERLPALEIVGGCCGTDARHVAALWGVPG